MDFFDEIPEGRDGYEGDPPPSDEIIGTGSITITMGMLEDGQPVFGHQTNLPPVVVVGLLVSTLDEFRKHIGESWRPRET